jgi:hypothetical protein
MKPEIWSVEDFLPNPEAVRDAALNAKWENWRSETDGQVYKRVAKYDNAAVASLIAKEMGRPVSVVKMGFRLNYADEPPNTLIHSDGDGWGKYAMVLSLAKDSPEENGTAFWEHNASGKRRLDVTDYEGLLQIVPYWDEPSHFTRYHVEQAKFNKAVFYHTALLHSRWPFTAFGSTPQDGRLTLVCFFT